MPRYINQIEEMLRATAHSVYSAIRMFNPLGPRDNYVGARVVVKPEKPVKAVWPEAHGEKPPRDHWY